MRSNLTEVGLYFLKLGTTAFGGPAAHIAMMHDEVVKRRKWLDEQHFLDMLGATNLIPGPNSTEMAIHIGFTRAGWPGLVVAGACFIVPAMVIVTALAWAYVQYGTTTEASSLLYGVKPVVIAIIVQALWGLGQKAVKGVLTFAVGTGVLLLYLFGADTIILLVVGGLIVMLAQNLGRIKDASFPALLLPAAGAGGAAAVPFSLSLMFLTFLKIGAVLFGSGYVLLAFLRADFVVRLGWLTDRQLVDAVAVGQLTPGPVFTTATFIGYVLAGVPGALVGTLGIFLPSFVFVALSNPFIPRLRASPWFGAALDGVNVASLGLMAAVTLQLGQAALVDPATIVIAVASAVLLVRFRTNTTFLIVGGAVAGLLSTRILG